MYLVNKYLRVFVVAKHIVRKPVVVHPGPESPARIDDDMVVDGPLLWLLVVVLLHIFPIGLSVLTRISSPARLTHNYFFFTFLSRTSRVCGDGPGAVCRPFRVRCAVCLPGVLMPSGIIPAGPAYLLRVISAVKIAWLRLRDFRSL